MQVSRKRSSSILEEGGSRENQPDGPTKQKGSGATTEAHDCQRWLQSNNLLEVAQHQQQPAQLGPQFW